MAQIWFSPTRSFECLDVRFDDQISSLATNLMVIIDPPPKVRLSQKSKCQRLRPLILLRALDFRSRLRSWKRYLSWALEMKLNLDPDIHLRFACTFSLSLMSLGTWNRSNSCTLLVLPLLSFQIAQSLRNSTLCFFRRVMVPSSHTSALDLLILRTWNKFSPSHTPCAWLAFN
jgi:hypothetical protein